MAWRTLSALRALRYSRDAADAANDEDNEDTVPALVVAESARRLGLACSSRRISLPYY